jgi:transposase
MAQHFLLSAAARSLSAAKIMRMSDRRGRERVPAPALARHRRQAGLPWLRLHDLLRLPTTGGPTALALQGVSKRFLIGRELDRLELLLEQIKAIEAERDAMLAPVNEDEVPTPAKMLMGLKGIGAEFATVLWLEGLSRHFDNRRQVAAYAGLAPAPWQSGTVDRELGCRQISSASSAAAVSCARLSATRLKIRPWMSARSRLTNRSKVLNPGRSMAAERNASIAITSAGSLIVSAASRTMPLSRRSAISS